MKKWRYVIKDINRDVFYKSGYEYKDEQDAIDDGVCMRENLAAERLVKAGEVEYTLEQWINEVSSITWRDINLTDRMAKEWFIIETDFIEEE